MTRNDPPRIAIIGSYVPRRCGIATFTYDVASAIKAYLAAPSAVDSLAAADASPGVGVASSAVAPSGGDVASAVGVASVTAVRSAAGGSSDAGTVVTGSGVEVPIVALNDREESYDYGPEVVVEIHQHRRADYVNAADVLNTSHLDVVSLQHEYGLFGGDCGDYLFELLDRLHRPVVSTLHSILSEPSDKQRDVLQRVCMRSSAVVVMAERARTLLEEVYAVPSERIRLIPHGVPTIPFGDTEPFKKRFNLQGRLMILTFGLLGPGKGIETMLDALGRVAPDHPDVAYVVLGVTHPAVKRESGEFYRISLERRAVELGIQKNVLFHNRYVSDTDLREYLQAADIYVTPYRTKEQITSGTLAYALAAGKAIISTPYWHAQELLVNGRGRLVEIGDVEGFASSLRELIEKKDVREKVRRAAHDFGKSMVWPRVAASYVETLSEAARTFADATRDPAAERKVLLRMSLPEPRLDHLFAMTDDTGMLQHALYATPDRRHGYCTDDNARALIVAAMAHGLFQDEQVQPYLRTYLSFLHFAQNPDTGRFRNFISYDRRWLEEDGSDDCQGRAVWALGYLISHAPDESMERLATDMFRAAIPALTTLSWPRSWALAILGLHYYLRRFPDDAEARGEKSKLAERLDGAFAGHATSDWPWFEDTVTYDNGRLPQALIIAGLQLKRRALLDRGQRVLQWLMDRQVAPEGHLSVIGNKGWLTRDGHHAKHDQQALEPAALIGACKASFRASGDTKWLLEMRRCFEWFVGRNDLGLSMIDFKSRGCFDGLKASGVNENQGAESVLSWLLSLLIMHEMQTGDAPDVG